MTLQRMDNVGIVVESGGTRHRARRPARRDAMMRTPDGHGRLELSRFLAPAVVSDHRTAPVNSLGYLRVMFAVDDLDATLTRLRAHGAQLVSSEVVRYEDSYRLCYIRGPEGLLLGLAEPLS